MIDDTNTIPVKVVGTSRIPTGKTAKLGFSVILEYCTGQKMV